MDVDTLDLILGILIEVTYIAILLIHRYKDQIQRIIGILIGYLPLPFKFP